MLKLEDYKTVFAAVGLIGVLLFASPALSLIVHLPGGEKFSELWVLGPEHMAAGYPFNVSADVNYLVYMGVGNHLGESTYYSLRVKFRNQTDYLSNVTADAPSPLPSLYEYHLFLQDGQNWSQPLTFSFLQVSTGQNRSMVSGLTVNDVTLSVYKPNAWNEGNSGYFYELFMELWIYNITSDAFQFNNRFVGLWLNMTGAS
jgi:hypothetical protein